MNRSTPGLPVLSPTPAVHSDSRPSSQWCHPAISSSVIPFSSCPQSLPVSEYFPMSQLFAWGGQSTGVSALASSVPKKSQGWSPSEWTGWISLQSKGLSSVTYFQNFYERSLFHHSLIFESELALVLGSEVCDLNCILAVGDSLRKMNKKTMFQQHLGRTFLYF